MGQREKIFLVGIITVAAALTFSVTLARAVFIAPTDQIELPAGEVMRERVSTYTGLHPDRIIVPTLGIDAPVRDVGIGRSGNMATPERYSEVGWYRYGAVPGTRGSAVMAGHVDNGFSLAGVFSRLENVRPGADVFIISKTGTKLRFIVDEVASYSYKEVPTERLFNRADDAWLVLVTCAGNWISEDKTYSQRLVVYARLE